MQESPNFLERATSAKKEFDSVGKFNMRSNSKNPRLSDSKYYSGSDREGGFTGRELVVDQNNYTSGQNINPRQINFNTRDRSSILSEDDRNFSKKGNQGSFSKTINAKRRENF